MSVKASSQITLSRFDNTFTHVYIKYADELPTQNTNIYDYSTTTTKYIGFAYTASNTAPESYADYSWSLIKGDDAKEIANIAPLYYLAADGVTPPDPTEYISLESDEPGVWTVSVPTYIDNYKYWTCIQTVYTLKSDQTPYDAVSNVDVNAAGDLIVELSDGTGTITSASQNSDGNLLVTIDDSEDYGAIGKILNVTIDNNGNLQIEIDANEIVWSQVVLHNALNTANENAKAANEAAQAAQISADAANANSEAAMEAIEDMEVSISEISTTADKINLLVQQGSTASNLKMTAGAIKAISDEIDFDGYVTFTNLSDSDGTTTINGGNITTGTMTLGGTDHNGSLVVQDANNNTIAKFNNSGNTIGGFDIDSSSLYTGSKTSRKSTNSGVYLGSDYIALGKYNETEQHSPFEVSSAGALYCKGATITGGSNISITGGDTSDLISLSGTSYKSTMEPYGFTTQNSSYTNKAVTVEPEMVTVQGQYSGSSNVSGEYSSLSGLYTDVDKGRVSYLMPNQLRLSRYSTFNGLSGTWSSASSDRVDLYCNDYGHLAIYPSPITMTILSTKYLALKQSAASETTTVKKVKTSYGSISCSFNAIRGYTPYIVNYKLSNGDSGKNVSQSTVYGNTLSQSGSTYTATIYIKSRASSTTKVRAHIWIMFVSTGLTSATDPGDDNSGTGDDDDD